MQNRRILYSRRLSLLRLSRHEIEDVSVLYEAVPFGTSVIVSSDVNSLVVPPLLVQLRFESDNKESKKRIFLESLLFLYDYSRNEPAC